MRSPRVVILAIACAAAWAIPARAQQLTDAERAAARELFKEGDQLQRSGKFAEALDKFQRAEQVVVAPTNVLRIAECQAALGRLVEAAESYRSVAHWQLGPGAPAQFQSAVDQARGELSQVEPRVPKLVAQVTPPPGTPPSSVRLAIDGTAVPPALLGEPVPLDPGEHRVQVTAPGYASPEQIVTLRERETKTVALELRPVPGAAAVPAPPVAPAPASSAPPPPPPPPPYESGAGGKGGPEAVRRSSRTSLLLGAHLGLEVATGRVPLSTSVPSPSGDTVDASNVSGAGVAYALDGDVRFARHWLLGLTLEHAAFGAGQDPSKLAAGITNLSSQTTSLGLVGGYVVDPDRVSFVGEVGLQSRWYSFTFAGIPSAQTYTSGELLLGAGIWVPLGRSFRLVPEATAGLGSFTTPGTNETTGPGHAFVMLGVAGFYNVEM